MGQNILAAFEAWSGVSGFSREVLPIVNFVKETCNPRMERRFSSETVMCRTSQSVHFRQSVTQKEETRKRRARRFQWGLLSEPWEPFESVGNIILDLRELVFGSLVQNLSVSVEGLSEESKPQIRGPSQKQHEVKDVAAQQGETEDEDVPQLLLPHRREAGLGLLLEAVARSEAIVVALHGGQRFHDLVGQMKGEARLSSSRWRWSSRRRKTPPDMAEKFQTQEDQELRERKVKVFQEKLLATYYILVSLSNLRSRDLKSKSPLPHRLVSMLRANGRDNSGMKQIRDTSSDVPGSANTVNPVNPLTHCQQANAREKYQSLLTPPPRIRCKDDVLFRDIRTPMWQTVVCNESEDLPAMTQATTSNKSSNPMEVLSNMRNRFVTLQQRLEEYYKHKTEKMDREQIRRFRQKFLALSPQGPLDVTLALMRAAVMVPEHEVTANVTPALWFQKLQAESISLGADGRPQTQSVFAKLQRFHQEDGSSFPNAKEKLCLMVMSLPVTEICTWHWQAATELILKDMLFVSPTVLRQWLHYRKLPYMI